MFNFFQNAEISVDYDFENFSMPNTFEKMPPKKYIFLSPYAFEEKPLGKYVTSPYSHQENKEAISYPQIISNEDEEIEEIIIEDDDEATNETENYNECLESDEETMEQEENAPIAIRLEEFEMELINNSEQTETIFYSDGSFITNLPSGEKYENKFEDSTIAPYYLEELSLGFEDITGFSVEYLDKTTNLTKKWLLTYNKIHNEYYLHGLNDDLEQVDSIHEGNQDDFKTMVKAVIQNCLDSEIKTATFYQ